MIFEKRIEFSTGENRKKNKFSGKFKSLQIEKANNFLSWIELNSSTKRKCQFNLFDLVQSHPQ